MGPAPLIDATRPAGKKRPARSRLVTLIPVAITLEGAALTAVALVITRRSGRAGVGLTSLAAGIVGTIVGVGIGVMHLVKAAVTPAGIAGLGCLVTGLFLLAVGAVVSIGLLSGWWRLLAIPVAAVLVQFLLVPLPVAIYATNLPPTPLGDETPADSGLEYEDVAFSTADGVTLSGWYIPSANRAAVALLHGSGSTRSSVVEHASVLARHGYGVLLYDDRGHGRSGGDGMDFGWWGDLDLAAAMTYLQTRSDVDPERIGAVGLSMGGEQALNAAATDERIRVVVGEGIEPRVPADHHIDTSAATGWAENAVNVIVVEAAALLTDAPKAMPLSEAAIAAAPRPVLIIAGKGEIDSMRAVEAAAPGNVQVWALPDTPHTGGLREHPQDWAERVTTFLDASLTDRSGE